MDDVIKILRDGHRQILKDMDCLAGLEGVECVKVDLLKNLEREILNHISRLDAGVFFPLKKLVKLTDAEEKFLDASRQELEDIKIFSLVFFEKFKGEKQGLLWQGFKNDALRLGKKLRERFDKEENSLFPFLNQLWKKFCGN